jgi:transposase
MNGGRAKKQKAEEQVRVRRYAVEQITLKGARVEDIADALGYGRSTVFSWIQKYKDGGLDSLETKFRSGRPAKLDKRQQRRLFYMILGRDPRQLQLPFALWTRETVGTLIETQFDVVMSDSAVGRLLRRMGFSPQRPTWRAYESDDEEVKRWKTVAFPAIRAEAKKLGAIVLFQDEASVRSDFHAGTTWGLVGVTPVVRTTGARYSVNMISSVSAQGMLHFRVIEEKVDADAFISYLQALMEDISDQPIFLVVDGHPAHRAKKTKEWVEKTEGRLRLFQLPGYSPQLNPDEWIWKSVKADRVGRAGIESHDDLRAKAESALQRLVDTPKIILGFFRSPDLHYITA